MVLELFLSLFLFVFILFLFCFIVTNKNLQYLYSHIWVKEMNTEITYGSAELSLGKKLLNREQRTVRMQTPTQSRYQSHKAHEMQQTVDVSRS